jgi:hypothetical protein
VARFETVSELAVVGQLAVVERFGNQGGKLGLAVFVMG